MCKTQLLTLDNLKKGGGGGGHCKTQLCTLDNFKNGGGGGGGGGVLMILIFISYVDFILLYKYFIVRFSIQCMRLRRSLSVFVYI